MESVILKLRLQHPTDTDDHILVFLLSMMLSQGFLRKEVLLSVKKKTLVETDMDADTISLVQVHLQLLLELRHIWNRMMYPEQLSFMAAQEKRAVLQKHLWLVMVSGKNWMQHLPGIRKM